jgi:hypothetical protein
MVGLSVYEAQGRAARPLEAGHDRILGVTGGLPEQP